MPDFVPLDNVVHADLKVKVSYDKNTGDSINQALVFPTEFNELQREYPIVFRRSEDGKLHAVVLLGLDEKENLFLKENNWDAAHIPAIRMCGPFTLALRDGAQGVSEDLDPVIQVDMAHINVSDKAGHPVFLPQGGYSPYLSQIIKALRKLHVGSQVEEVFFSELQKYNLIEEITLEAKLSETENYVIPGVYTISRARMAELSANELHELNKQGLLEHCFAIMSSTGNMSRLVDMKIMQKTHT